MLVLAATGCESGRAASGGGVGHVHVTLTQGADTLGYEVPVRARRCSGGRGLVIDGASHGNGLLVWLRSGGALDSGSYPLLGRGDSSTARGAVVAVRYVISNATHGFSVDDGSAVVGRTTPPFDVRVKGHGLETQAAAQRAVVLSLEHVPLDADTANCRVQL